VRVYRLCHYGIKRTDKGRKTRYIKENCAPGALLSAPLTLSAYHVDICNRGRGEIQAIFDVSWEPSKSFVGGQAYLDAKCFTLSCPLCSLLATNVLHTIRDFNCGGMCILNHSESVGMGEVARFGRVRYKVLLHTAQLDLFAGVFPNDQL